MKKTNCNNALQSQVTKNLLCETVTHYFDVLAKFFLKFPFHCMELMHQTRNMHKLCKVTFTQYTYNII